jgi:hypothetical protein
VILARGSEWGMTSDVQAEDPALLSPCDRECVEKHEMVHHRQCLGKGLLTCPAPSSSISALTTRPITACRSSPSIPSVSVSNHSGTSPA